ncbi:MAG: D-alanyl-D-alanine carboxypeptidase/D-alanyl-D-alanine-endopeptidase, partial [Candidatus Neomarinimicrobiota bacterium]
CAEVQTTQRKVSYLLTSDMRLFLLLAAFQLFFACAYRSAIYYPRITGTQTSGLSDRIEEAVGEVDSNVNLGIKVVSVMTGEVIYEDNANHLFTPASNVKLFTAAAALHILGPSYRFHTRMYTDSTRTGDVLEGNLYLVGSGDPDFSQADLEEMVDDVLDLGIRQIRGDIIVDNTAFDSDPWGPGWMWDEGPWWYFAPVDAMTFNDNCVTITVSPGDQNGDSAVVTLDPPTDYVQVRVAAVTAERDSVAGLEVNRRWKTKENIVDITGEIHTDEEARSFVLSVERPALYAGSILRDLLKKAGIEFRGGISQDTLSSDTLLVTTFTSRPLSLSIRNFLKISDNLTGELLIKKMGSVTHDAAGSWGNGLMTVKTFMQDEVGIDTTKLTQADGSGVSRYNLVSASHIVQLLLWVNGNFQISPEFFSALPIGRTDGTLRNRMLTVGTQATARAKTGTLKGVSSLSGYLTSEDNEMLAFSILMNGYVGTTAPYRKLQDRIVSILSDFSRFR